MWQFSQTIDGITKACEELETPDHRRQCQLLQRDAGRRYLPDARDWRGGHPGRRAQGRRAAISAGRDGLWCCCAGRSRATRRMSRPSLARRNMPRRCWARFGDFRRRWNWRRKPRCRRRSCEMIGSGLVESAKDCSEGGLAVTLAECGFARGVGAEVNLSSNGLVPEFVLFGEDASRVLISCDPQNVERIQQVAVQYGLSAEQIGNTVLAKVGHPGGRRETAARQTSPNCARHGTVPWNARCTWRPRSGWCLERCRRADAG